MNEKELMNDPDANIRITLNTFSSLISKHKKEGFKEAVDILKQAEKTYGVEITHSWWKEFNCSPASMLESKMKELFKDEL
jgi:uncharacterized Zn finger protein